MSEKRWLVDVEKRISNIETFYIYASTIKEAEEKAIDMAINHKWDDTKDHEEMSIAFIANDEES